MVECGISLQESSWVTSLGPDSKFFEEGAHWSNLDPVPIFGWVRVGHAVHTWRLPMNRENGGGKGSA